ncbi:hypothetical protein PN36_12700 [Candidatus Thiomargarita nelsonii]|uniref:Uncharacterized protein n=1 Tax=Candidatus Thiomargarita nelsonii TaxID=1003181 RepID=A0A4E0QPJ9_9GAMM|nr:hypothetical protein PN36_12700 [Candidatus Thiomargarita nelsonii]
MGLALLLIFNIGIQVTGFVSEKVALSTFRLLITLVGKWFAMTRVTHVAVWNGEEGGSSA